MLLYGEDAKFIIAFTGNPAATNFNNLELMQFHDDTKTFEFRSVQFPTAKENAQKPIFSEANPELCTSCHRTDARPNLDIILWPRVFGAENDNVFREGKQADRKSEDYRSYTHFMETGKNRGRYQFLSPTHDPGSSLPNVTLGIYLNNLNFQKIAHKLATTPSAVPFRYALTGAIACAGQSGSAEDFIPKNLLDKMELPLKTLILKTKKAQASSFSGRLFSLRRFYPHAPEDLKIKAQAEAIDKNQPVEGIDDPVRVAGLRMIVEELLGIYMTDWSLEFDGYDYIFADSEGGIKRLEGPLVDEFFAKEPKLRELFHLSSGRAKLCGLLKKKSLEALAGVPPRML